MKKIKEAFLNASKCEKCMFIINVFSSIIVIIFAFCKYLVYGKVQLLFVKYLWVYQ